MNKESSILRPTLEMEEVFVNRTKTHRLLVRKNLLIMQGYFDLSPDLLKQVANNHDLSKFKEPERTAYTWMTWMYHCQHLKINFIYPPGVKTLVQRGWHHHIVSNSHHPEAHTIPDLMTTLDMVEMICDWTAISQEQNLNGGSCMPWAMANLDKKWNLSCAQKNFIFAAIKELDKRNQAYKPVEGCNIEAAK